MEPYQQRVVDEKRDLDEKATKLSNFIGTSETFETIVMPPCADCGGVVGQDHGPPDGWKLEVSRCRDRRGYSAIGLHMPKTCGNVGSALRAAGCYGAAMVAATGSRFGRAPTDTMKMYRHIPLIRVDDLQSVVPFDCVPVAVDLIEGSQSLFEYEHPERAFYVFGPEDGTLERSVTQWCRDLVHVPTSGCMNLAATVNVVLYDRHLKLSKRGKCG